MVKKMSGFSNFGSAQAKSVPKETGKVIPIQNRRGDRLHMSGVWSCNEWDQLEEVIVGNPLNARYPTPDRSSQLAEFPDRSLAEIPCGSFPQQIIEETEEDLNGFARILEGLGITVRRPDTWPHEAKFSTIHWEAQGYYNYCPRDVLLVIGDHIIETPNVIRSRAQETFSYRTLLMEYMKSGAKWYSAPKPMLLDSLFEGVDLNRPTPRNDEPAFDAANVLRFGKDLIYLVSATGNELGELYLPGMDATSLTSSLGYDGSIPEMYSAWVSGCAVVMLTKEQIRSGPDLVPVLREAEVTVLFCPPMLLTTLTPTPEMDLPYPLCRYIVPAGEAFPSALVEPWTRARRQIINTYGPTEASSDTSRQSLRPGEPITIGSPFANVTYVILEVDQLQPLPHGEVGELCIGGVHVARGYRNLPEQTAQKFITHPQFGRLYRTADKCKIDIQTQRVHFLGRIDTQLKVRGHRVEAQAVEDILQTQFGEIEAAVLDYQNETLVAFVAAPSVCEGEISEVAPAPAEWAARVTATLAKQLPAPSVPTRIFLVEKFVMKPVSGKIDRKCLPNLSHPLRNAEPEAEDTRWDTLASARDTGDGGVKVPDAEAGMDPECEEVLSICRAVFETDAVGIGRWIR